MHVVSRFECRVRVNLTGADSGMLPFVATQHIIKQTKKDMRQ